MGWLNDLLHTRRRRDEAAVEDAYLRLASSVMGKNNRPHFNPSEVDDVDAALAAVLHHYNLKPIEIPETVTDINERIELATRPHGMMRRTVVLEGAWWKDASGAYLGHLKDVGPVAILPNKAFGIGYHYFDPISQRTVRLNRKTANNLAPDAICFYRPFPQRELTNRDVYFFMLGALKHSDYLMLLACALAALFLGFMTPRVVSMLFSQVIPSGLPSIVPPLAALFIGITVSQALVNITSSVVHARIETKLTVQLEAATYARVLLLPSGFFKDYAAGDLTQRALMMSSLMQIYTQFISLSLTAAVSCGYIFQLVTFAPTLTIPAIVTIALEAAATIAATREMVQVNKEVLDKQTKLSGLQPTLMEGIQKIKLAGAEKRMFARWGLEYAKVTTATYDLPALIVCAPSLIPLISVAGTIVIYYIAGITEVGQANYMAFNTAYGSITAAIMALAASMRATATMQPYLDFVDPIMRAVPESVSTQRQVNSLRGSIVVSDVSFAYNENAPLVLSNLSLRIMPGEYVAIVGRTGCGKSTLMRLLLGFEKPLKGAIYYDGIDISGADIRSLRKNIGVVMQNGRLLAGDIFSNIIVACPSATMDQAWEAAEIAGIADDIRAMPMGMHTIISEGSGGISGGQRQRIMIARAVCGKPSVLMFDEATSALDNITQRHVSETLAKLNCTRIVIAHRLSTIKEADTIITIDRGHIVEQGRYEELIAQNGTFAELVERQRLEQS